MEEPVSYSPLKTIFAFGSHRRSISSARVWEDSTVPNFCSARFAQTNISPIVTNIADAARECWRCLLKQKGNRNPNASVTGATMALTLDYAIGQYVRSSP